MDEFLKEITENKISAVHFVPAADYGTTEDDLLKILAALKNNISVNELALGGVLSKKPSAQALSDFFRDNKTISTFNCSALFDLGAQSEEKWNFLQILKSGIAANETLKTLIIAENPLRENEIAAIVEALKNHTSITHLYLSAYDIPYQFANLLSPLLASNKTLKTLELYMATDFSAGFDLFAKAVAENTTLTDLTLANCGFDDNDLPKLLDVIKHNKSLKNLDLRGNFYNEAGVNVINELISENKNLHIEFDA